MTNFTKMTKAQLIEEVRRLKIKADSDEIIIINQAETIHSLEKEVAQLEGQLNWRDRTPPTIDTMSPFQLAKRIAKELGTMTRVQSGTVEIFRDGTWTRHH